MTRAEREEELSEVDQQEGRFWNVYWVLTGDESYTLMASWNPDNDSLFDWSLTGEQDAAQGKAGETNVLLNGESFPSDTDSAEAYLEEVIEQCKAFLLDYKG